MEKTSLSSRRIHMWSMLPTREGKPYKTLRDTDATTLQRALDKARGRTCHECGKLDSSGWYRHPNCAGAYLCHRCYLQKKNARDLLAGRTCLGCSNKAPSSWHRHPIINGASLCGPCYSRFHATHTVGRTCHECGCTTTRSWLKHPSGSGASWCVACWQRDYRAKKRAAELATKKGTS
ncbi:unnamed protein product [Peniophora sp. CBMAI 1063]|nr:unnamed protein product [Peniophora sp. CBMAI 1063]